ncbi:8918_t:CDS:2, partial [Rhizophagus irregularis]
EFDEFEELDGFGDAMEPSDHAPRFTSLNISSIANLDHTILYYTPGQTKIFPHLNIVLQERILIEI